MAPPAEHPGKAVYDKACAACHNNPEATRSPSLATLQAMRYQTIDYALTQGKMQIQASGLTPAEKSAVIDFLVGSEATSDDWIARIMCAADRRTVNVDAPATVTGFGFDLKNHRRLSAAQAGLRTDDLRRLELAWAIGFPKATVMRSQPAVVGSTLFLPVADASRVFAIDVSGEPCVQWVYENEAPLRTGAAFGQLSDGRQVVVFGELGTNIHMVDALAGDHWHAGPASGPRLHADFSV
jgi:polyvinyl alcohol dehydrogenase (cytochrome)